MADVKNVVTLGIGASPGGLIWFFTTGLEAGEEAVVGEIVVTARPKRLVMVARAGSNMVTAKGQNLIVTARPAEVDALGNVLITAKGRQAVFRRK